MAFIQNAIVVAFYWRQPDGSMELSEWVVNILVSDGNFSSGMLFTHEAIFYCIGEVKHLKTYNTELFKSPLDEPIKDSKPMVWCGIWGNKIIASFFFDTNLKNKM